MKRPWWYNQRQLLQSNTSSDQSVALDFYDDLRNRAIRRNSLGLWEITANDESSAASAYEIAHLALLTDNVESIKAAILAIHHFNTRHNLRSDTATAAACDRLRLTLDVSTDNSLPMLTTILPNASGVVLSSSSPDVLLPVLILSTASATMNPYPSLLVDASPDTRFPTTTWPDRVLQETRDRFSALSMQPSEEYRALAILGYFVQTINVQHLAILRPLRSSQRSPSRRLATSHSADIPRHGSGDHKRTLWK